MSTEKAPPERSYTPSEKHPAEDDTISYNQRIQALENDKSLSSDQRWAAVIAMSDPGWIERAQPPLFVAALSLDPPAVKAAAVEAALRAGADPNELDHDLGRGMHCARALACFVDPERHHELRGTHDGMRNNLPAIEAMLRHGADPRLASPFHASKSALAHVRWAREREPDLAPDFFEAASRMLESAAAELDGE